VADGAAVEKALERIMGRMEWKDPFGTPYPHGMMAGEALVELAGANIDADNDPDRATVVLHVTQPLAAKEPQLTLIENGPSIPTPTAHRMTCDARCQVVLHTENGTVIGVGRTTRVIPMWLRRLVRGRDRGCRFPGCDRTKHLHIHHIRHWSNGGPSDLDNLILLCARHHRLVHEHGWSITGSADQPVVGPRNGVPYTPVRKLVTTHPPWDPLRHTGLIAVP